MAKTEKTPKEKHTKPAVLVRVKHEKGEGQSMEIVLSPIVKVAAFFVTATIFIANAIGAVKQITKFFKKKKKK